MVELRGKQGLDMLLLMKSQGNFCETDEITTAYVQLSCWTS